jgi:hypothetical protein
MFFANEQRDNVREENPGVSFGQVGKILGERWKALSDKQRAPYEAKAAADKKRYEDEKQAYNVSARLPPKLMKCVSSDYLSSKLRLTPKRRIPPDRPFFSPTIALGVAGLD